MSEPGRLPPSAPREPPPERFPAGGTDEAYCGEVAGSIGVMSITPFDSGGALDLAELERHLVRFLPHRLSVYVCSQGSGEGLSLTLDEKEAVYRTAVRVLGGTPRGGGRGHRPERRHRDRARAGGAAQWDRRRCRPGVPAPDRGPAAAGSRDRAVFRRGRRGIRLPGRARREHDPRRVRARAPADPAPPRPAPGDRRPELYGAGQPGRAHRPGRDVAGAGPGANRLAPPPALDGGRRRCRRPVLRSKRRPGARRGDVGRPVWRVRRCHQPLGRALCRQRRALRVGATPPPSRPPWPCKDCPPGTSADPCSGSMQRTRNGSRPTSRACEPRSTAGPEPAPQPIQYRRLWTPLDSSSTNPSNLPPHFSMTLADALLS